MVNCCIHRMLQNSPRNGKETPKEKKKVGTLFDDVAEEKRKVDTFSEFFERFIEGDVKCFTYLSVLRKNQMVDMYLYLLTFLLGFCVVCSCR
jgi:hypothetical protein